MTGIISQVIAFGYRVALSQMIGAENLGLYQLIMPVYSVLLSLTSVGLTSSVAYLSARFQAMGNSRAVWQLRNQAIRFFFLLAILPGALLLIFSDGASVYILGDARTRLGLMLLVPCLLLTGVENMQKNYFYGVGFVRPAALTELIEQIIRTVLVLGLLMTFLPCSPEKIVGFIVIGMILCEVYSAVTQTVLFRKYLGPPESLKGEAQSLRTLKKEIIRIAAPVGFTALLGNLIGSANSVLIPRLLVQGGLERSEAMSEFGVMFGMTLPMLFLPTAFLGALNLVLAPKLSESLALGRKDDIRRRIRKAVAAANLILIPSLALLAVIGPGLGATLYKDARVGNHMDLLALGVLLNCWEALIANCLNGLNFQAFSAKIALLTDVILLAITCATVGRPEFGLRGFAWGYVLSAAIGAYLSWKKLSKETGLKLPVFEWFMAPILAATLSASCTQLLYTVLLRDGLTILPAGSACLVFGLLLYLAALQAQGVSLTRLLRENPLACKGKRR
jgi:stage V sporulation protein B